MKIRIFKVLLLIFLYFQVSCNCFLTTRFFYVNFKKPMPPCQSFDRYGFFEFYARKKIEKSPLPRVCLSTGLIVNKLLSLEIVEMCNMFMLNIIFSSTDVIILSCSEYYVLCFLISLYVL